MIELTQIRTDGGTQARAAINEETVAEYAEAMANPTTVFPPVIVYYDGTNYWLADGFHRAAAWERLGRTEVPAEIRQGDRRQAILHSVAANAAHGLRRTNADKRRAVMTLLEDPEWGQWSDQAIAEKVRVGRAFVTKMRGECILSSDDKMAVPAPVKRIVTRNGKTYEMNVARIGSAATKSRPLTADEEALVDQSSGETVYLLSAGERVKIGFSRHGARHRVGQLLTSTPKATVVAVSSGTMKQEKAAHALLECERDAGEWFVCAVDDAIAAMRQAGLDPITATTSQKSEAATPDDPHAKVRKSLAKLTRDGLEDEVIGLRDENATLRASVKELKAERDRLNQELAEHRQDDLGRALGNAQRRATTAEGRMKEHMATAKRLEYRLKLAEAERDEAKRALENQMIPL